MADNSKKYILDLCGGTGAWSKPYADAGYRVVLLTLPQHDVTDVVFEKHAMLFRKQDKHYYDDTCILYEDVYGILAAPPCTEFSLAKNGSHRQRDLASGLKVVEACQKIIWQCRLHNKLAFWALENPRGYLRQFLGIPPLTFEQWWYGDIGIKPTDIWGYFKTPKRTCFERPDHPALVKRYSSGKLNSFYWSAPKSPDWLDTKGLTREVLRSITPPGFANAFYKANR